MRRSLYQKWLANRFDDFILYGTDGSHWDLYEKISEKTLQVPAVDSHIGKAYAEAQAVYYCRQVHGNEIGVVKIRMQVGLEYPPSEHSSVRADLASEVPSIPTRQELYTLKHLGENGCSVTPKLLDNLLAFQTESMPVPGGYLVFHIMERVPGVSLENFWQCSFEKREKIRGAFATSLAEFLKHRAYAHDSRLANIMYDEENNKCYFVDHEATEIRKDKAVKFSRGQYFIWGLAYRDGDTEIF